MTHIMCSRKLWRQLGYSRRQCRDIADQRMSGVFLGPWVAKVFTDQGRDLILGVETRIYLTLLFPLPPAAHFQLRFADALANVLAHAGVPRIFARAECAAVEFEPLVPLRNRELTRMLNHIEFFCGIEFAYHDDLGTVQRNLNLIPYPHLDPCEPIAVIKRLFKLAEPMDRFTAH